MCDNAPASTAVACEVGWGEWRGSGVWEEGMARGEKRKGWEELCFKKRQQLPPAHGNDAVNLVQ